MTPLAAFQDSFVSALRGDARGLAALAEQPGFAVYRNTVLKGCVDALEASYPAVRRLVGDEWFRAAAARYALEHPPATPVLVEYGAGFARFAGELGAGEMPYLADVATLERWWTEAHIARDEAPLDAGALAGLSPEALGSLHLRPHASARWAWLDTPAMTIWRRNRASGAVDLSDVAWRSEGVLIVRPEHVVEIVELERAACAFLDACAEGITAGGAAACALREDPGADLGEVVASLLRARAFAV